MKSVFKMSLLSMLLFEKRSTNDLNPAIYWRESDEAFVDATIIQSSDD